MVIRRMKATFGCLDGAELELHDGLNAITLSNEGGKSTWAAFLLAMFYGIDTGERSARGRMAAKTRYQPWNGKPMEGTMELEHRGQTIVLQRTSPRGKPMAAFRAYDKTTGLEIPALTADNCGPYFLGVERGVFRRSAFLSGDELTVTEDGDLSRRLENLAAAGTAQDSYPAAAGKLKLWKNRCRYHQNGLIPETEEKLRQTEETLEMLTELRRQRLEAAAAWERCGRDAEAQAEADAARWKARKAQAAAALADANARAEQTASRAANLPPEETLRQLLARLEQSAETLPPEPPCPPALDGISAEAVFDKARRDQQEYDALAASSEKPARPWILAAALCAVLAAVSAPVLWQAALALLPLAAGCALRWLAVRRRNRHTAENRDKAAALLRSYGVQRREDLLPAAMTRRDWLMTRDRLRQRSWETDTLVEEVADFAPQVTGVPDAVAALRDALDCRRQAAEAQQRLEQAQLQWQSIVRPQNPELEAQKEKAAALRLQAETLRSREEALGGWEKLETRRQRLREELDALCQRETALTLAQAALDAAHDQLAQVYAPRLTAMAGAYLQWLTGSRYDALILQPGMQLLAREQATGLTRPLASLSRGTQDQAWLALRLSMTRLLLPPDAPVVLDDALVTFDRERTAAAMAVLEQEDRQVILFSCK